MKGQHIYMRYRTEQGLAGTWTAAVTKNVLDANTLSMTVLPKCNLDELFANDVLRRQDNSILRIYPVKGDALVVSRSFWETDTLTESAGRRGAYTVSHIFTGEDRVAFVKDCYANAANPALFEPYDAVVDRMRSVGPSRFSVDDSYSLTDTVCGRSGLAALEQAGLTREQFLSLMHVILCRKRAAVVLPEALRLDWIDNGVDHGAAFAVAFSEFFPYWMRMYLSLASAWSCRIGNEMTRGLNLLFVYPDSSSGLSELRGADCSVLDLEHGRSVENAALPASRDYLEFLWETRRDPSQREAFWDYCVQTLGLADPEDGGWPSVEGLELAFHLYSAARGSIRLTPGQYRQYYIEASAYLRHVNSPELESFRDRAVSVFTEQALPVDEALEEALVADLESSERQSARQQSEYALLFGLVMANAASEDTLAALSAELKKPARGAAELFTAFLERELDAGAFPGRNSDSLIAWIMTLYEQYFSGSLEKDSLFRLLSEIVAAWVKAACEDPFREDIPHLRLLRACLIFLRSEEREPAQMRELSYRSLLRCEWLSENPDNSRSCASNCAALEEEYDAPESAQAYAFIPMAFLHEFERNCSVRQCSERLLRRFYEFSALNGELLAEALRVYETHRASLPQDATVIRADVLGAERLPLRASAAAAFEKSDLQADPSYYPGSSLLRQTLLNLGSQRRELLSEVYLPCLQRMREEERTVFCRMIRELNGDGPCSLENLLFLLLAAPDSSALAPVASAELGGDLRYRFTLFNKHMKAEESPELRSVYQSFFLQWYAAYLSRSFQEKVGNRWRFAPEQLCAFLRGQFEDLSAVGKGSGLYPAAEEELSKRSWNYIAELTDDEQLSAADRKTLEAILEVLPYFFDKRALAIKQKIELLLSVDAAATPDLDAVCVQAEELGLQKAAAGRLLRRLETHPKPASDAADSCFSDNQKFALTVHYLLLRDGRERFSVPALCEEYGIAEAYPAENAIDAAFNLYRYADKFSAGFKDVLIGASDRILLDIADRSPNVFGRKRVTQCYSQLKSKSVSRADAVSRLLQERGILIEPEEPPERFGLPLTLVFCLLSALVSVFLVAGAALLSLALTQLSAAGAVAVIALCSLLGGFFLLLSLRLRAN